MVLSALAAAAGKLLSSPEFAGETDLHRMVTSRLLPILVRRRLLCRALVASLPWHQLAGQSTIFVLKFPGYL